MRYLWMLHHVIGKDRKSTRLNSSHITISYAVFCLKKKKKKIKIFIAKKKTTKIVLSFNIKKKRSKKKQIKKIYIIKYKQKKKKKKNFFFFNDTATTEIYTLSLHDALPISLLLRCGAFPDAYHWHFRRFAAERFPKDRKSTRLNSSHITISYAVFCLKK